MPAHSIKTTGLFRMDKPDRACDAAFVSKGGQDTAPCGVRRNWQFDLPEINPLLPVGARAFGGKPVISPHCGGLPRCYGKTSQKSPQVRLSPRESASVRLFEREGNECEVRNAEWRVKASPDRNERPVFPPFSAYFHLFPHPSMGRGERSGRCKVTGSIGYVRLVARMFAYFSQSVAAAQVVEVRPGHSRGRLPFPSARQILIAPKPGLSWPKILTQSLSGCEMPPHKPKPWR